MKGNFYINNTQFLQYQLHTMHHTTGETNLFPFTFIGYILSGSCKILCNGTTYSLKENDLFYIYANTPYYSIWTGNPEIRFYSFHFSYSKDSEESLTGLKIYKNFSPELFHLIYKEKGSHPLRATSYLYLMLDELVSKEPDFTAEAAPSCITPAVDYIESNYMKKITVRELAGLCSISEPHFYRLFRKTYHVSPITYKNSVAIRHALDLLKNTDHTIEEISYMLGFTSSNYFRKVFMDIVGKSPKEFKKSTVRLQI